MPRIDARCTTCDHTWEYHRPIADYPAVAPCPSCASAATEQWHPPPRTRWTVDPVVVFRAPDGSIRFPGDATGQAAGRYAAQGYERIEIRGAHDMRRFEKAMTAHERSRIERRIERKEQMREQRESISRSELRRQMTHMTPMGRDLARAAMRRNDHKPRERAGDPGFISEVYSYDRSNRDESRDSRGARRRD